MTFYPDIGHRDERGDWPTRYEAAVAWLQRKHRVGAPERLARHVLPLLEEAYQPYINRRLWFGDLDTDPPPAIIALIQDVERMQPHDH